MDPNGITVLRLPRPDCAVEASFVLLHVSSTGRRELDIKLIGTEQENVFSVSLKHNQISSLKSQNSPCNQDEWEEILLSVFRGKSPEEGHEDVIQGVEAIAKVEKQATSLTITIQKRIEGITQKLGTISLPSTDDEEIFLYEWCGSIIKSRDNTTQELNSLQAGLRERDSQIKKLKQSFTELVKLKGDHENALVQKFSNLLNEKKLKVRDQQRLLSSSAVDPAKLEVVKQQHKYSVLHSAGTSRHGKRKVEEAESESDDGFESMGVDKKEPGDSDSDIDDARTPDPESTASEASEDEAPPVPPVKKTMRANIGGKGKAKAKVPSLKAASEDDEAENFMIPPQRDLPFQKKAAAKPAPVSKPTPVIDGSETESDDEL